jgi:hypothetical protein
MNQVTMRSALSEKTVPGNDFSPESRVLMGGAGAGEIKTYFGGSHAFEDLAPALNLEACGFWGQRKGPRGALFTPGQPWFSGCRASHMCPLTPG